MFFLTAIEYLTAALIVLYLFGILTAWVYELRKNAPYLKMQKQLKCLEDKHLSAALRYAKSYKIRHDYLRQIQSLEKVQRFILENLLFIVRTQSKTEKSWL